jgi:hypothetical protein
VARLGSFAAPVDLPEHLRPWRAAGLDAFFLPDGLPDDQRAAPPVGQTAPFAPGETAAPAINPVAPASLARIDWPEPWQAIALRVRSKPQIIITYASLTADVTGKADPARRKLFQSILGYLAWPQGTSLFWPCTDAPGAPMLARNIFLNGALSFGVTVVACFGPEAAQIAQALFPPGAGEPDVRVLTLPAPEELLDLLPHELHQAVAALKALPLD